MASAVPGWPRVIIGLPRSFVHMGNDGREIRRYLLGDALNPVSASQVAMLPVWPKLLVFYSVLVAVSWYALHRPGGRRLLLVFVMALVPVAGLGAAWSGGEEERYLALFPFLLPLVVWAAWSAGREEESRPSGRRRSIWSALAEQPAGVQPTRRPRAIAGGKRETWLCCALARRPLGDPSCPNSRILWSPSRAGDSMSFPGASVPRSSMCCRRASSQDSLGMDARRRRQEYHRLRWPRMGAGLRGGHDPSPVGGLGGGRSGGPLVPGARCLRRPGTAATLRRYAAAGGGQGATNPVIMGAQVSSDVGRA